MKFRWYKSGDERKVSKYVGEIKNGKPNGQGTFTNPKRGKYVGEYKDGTRWNGEYTYFDGTKMIGEWKDGRFWNGYYKTKMGTLKKIVNGHPE